jgi:hypothetical protein
MLDASKIKQLYIQEKLPLEDVSIQLGVSRRTIARRCIELGFQVRTRGSGPRPSRVAIGYRQKDGYVFVHRPRHNRAMANGYVMRAVINWEEANGKPFPEGRHPHHDNENKSDDRPENIIPMTKGDHQREHGRRRKQAKEVK